MLSTLGVGSTDWTSFSDERSCGAPGSYIGGAVGHEVSAELAADGVYGTGENAGTLADTVSAESLAADEPGAGSSGN